MSRVENLFEILENNWADKGVLLHNTVAGPKGTRNMLLTAKALGLRIVIQYDLDHHPKAGDYVCGVAGPWAYQAGAQGEVCVASDWAALFRWVRNAKRRAGALAG